MHPLHIALAFGILTLVFGVAVVSLNSARLNLKSALDRERDAHLKASLTNGELLKQLSSKNTEILKWQERMDYAEADRVELRAERLTAENKVRQSEAALTYANEVIESLQGKVRQRDEKGRFLPRHAFKVKGSKLIEELQEVEFDALGATESALNMGRTLANERESWRVIEEGRKLRKSTIPTEPDKPSHRLTHGLTVKNPTEDEAKAIFAEAKRLGILSNNRHHEVDEELPWIWYFFQNTIFDGVTACKGTYPEEMIFVTATEFIARMQPLNQAADFLQPQSNEG